MSKKFNAGTLHAYVRHSPQYFNTACRATIPEYWEAELEMSTNLLEHFNANNSFTHFRIYGTSQDSAQDAIQDLVNQLRENNLTGTLKIRQ